MKLTPSRRRAEEQDIGEGPAGPGPGIKMKLTPSRRRAEEQDMGEGPAPAVMRLIEKATNSTAHEVDPRLLRAISLTIRYSNDEVRAAVQFLMFQMRKSHSQVLNR